MHYYIILGPLRNGHHSNMKHARDLLGEGARKSKENFQTDISSDSRGKREGERNRAEEFQTAAFSQGRSS